MKNSMIDFDFRFKDILKWKQLYEDKCDWKLSSQNVFVSKQKKNNRIQNSHRIFRIKKTPKITKSNRIINQNWTSYTTDKRYTKRKRLNGYFDIMNFNIYAHYRSIDWIQPLFRQRFHQQNHVFDNRMHHVVCDVSILNSC